MKLGAYTAVLHDRPIEEALAVLRDLGLRSAEINSGGFLPPVHLPVDRLRASADALTALNCNGNPLHPDPDVGRKHGRDVVEAVELAALLGVTRVVTMSGAPGAEPGARLPAWCPLPWESSILDARDHQWSEVAIPFWREVQARAADADVSVCIEMHPHNIVYNPATMIRLAESIGATHVGAEMDPSHLFWQGIDPVAAIGALGDLVRNAAAKDCRINPAARVNGVLDDRHVRVGPEEADAVVLGGRYTLSRWPADSSWDFVAVGRGHDVAFWREFLAALEKVDPDMAVNIEHEDAEFDRLEGLRVAVRTLLEASGQAPPAEGTAAGGTRTTTTGKG
jgi:sugar phosphate isomerase/epimerase